MIGPLITIRLKQLLRGLTGMGLFRMIFLMALLVFLSAIVFIQLSKEPNSYYAVGGLILLLLSIQTNRKDLIFLKTHFSNYKPILLSEYGIIALPFITSLIYHHQWNALLVLVVGIMLVSQTSYSYKANSINTKLQKLIPPDAFEYKAGVRKLIFVIVPLWIIGFTTSFYIASVPLLIFVLGVMVLSFYEKSEPYQMIIALELNERDFLFYKIKRQTILFSVVVAPLIIAFIIFNWESWYIPVIEYLIFVVIHAYLILTKYAYYEPNIKSPAAQIFAAIGVLGGMIPIFLPLILILGIRFYFMATDNLKLYLDDYN